eukprot:1187674-Prorocentrum_minimum.AAC.1
MESASSKIGVTVQEHVSQSAGTQSPNSYPSPNFTSIPHMTPEWFWPIFTFSPLVGQWQHSRPLYRPPPDPLHVMFTSGCVAEALLAEKEIFGRTFFFA